MFWFNKSDKEQVIEKAVDKLISKIDLDFLKNDVVEKIAERHYHSRDYYGGRYSHFADSVQNRLVDYVVEKQKQKVLDAMSDEEFAELAREGIKDHFKKAFDE